MEKVRRIHPRGLEFELDVPERLVEEYTVVGYEMATTSLFRTVTADANVVVDVGAHVGYFSLVAAHANPEATVVAVEASPENIDALRGNVEAVGVRVVAAAAGSVSGVAVVHVADASDNSAIVPHPSAVSTRRHEVPMVDFASLDLPRGGKLVVKIDVEGHEVEVLEGVGDAFDRYDDVRLFVELNPVCLERSGASAARLLEILSADFRTFVLDETARDWRELTDAAGIDELLRGRTHANIYCVPWDRALTYATVMHSSALGGAERSTTELANGLIRDGFMGAFLLPVPDHGLGARLQELGAAVDWVPSLDWWLIDPSAAAREKDWRLTIVNRPLIDIVRRRSTDLVVSETAVIAQGAVAAAAAGLPHLWYVHEFGDRDHGFDLPADALELGRFMREVSTTVVAVSESVRDHFFPGDPDAEVLNPAPEMSQSVRADGVDRGWSIGVVGNIHSGKNQSEVIRAIGLLRRAGLDVRLRLVGTGHDVEIADVSAMAHDEGVADLVDIPGWSERGDVYASLDAIVVPSRSEAFGRVPFEATHAGLPVIYADVAGPSEYLNNGTTGLAYPPGDVAALAAMIRRLHDDADLAARLVEAARSDLGTSERIRRRDREAARIWRVAATRPQSLSAQVLGQVAMLSTAEGSDWAAGSSEFWALYRDLEETLAKRVVAHESLLVEYDALRDALEQRLSAHESAMREHARALSDLERLRGVEAGRDAAVAAEAATRGELDQLAVEFRRVEAERNDVAGRLDAYERSRGGRFLTWFRRGVGRFVPPGTRRRGLYERSLRLAARTARIVRPVAKPMLLAPTPVESGFEFVATAHPLISIVIPVHGKWSYTHRCLASISEHRGDVPFEVIVVDDKSPDETLAHVRAIPGLRVVALEVNLGFTRAANAGIAAAIGRHVVLLNNDTEVHPGWVEALLDAAEPGVGIVGAKLVYPDGRLQEAGGVVFDDASGWNYGRFDDPEAPVYNYRRRVDYCSGAAILLTRELLDVVPGFDERYSPAYYEDTDLAFEARRHGLEVIYEPRAVVTHFEGISHGTDEAQGTKKYQVINREKFAEKWAVELTQQFDATRVDHDSVSLAATRRRRGTVVVIDHLVPMWREDSGSLRMWRILDALQRLDYDVVFVPENRFPTQPYTEELQRRGVLVWYGWNDIHHHLRQLAPVIDFAIVARQPIATALLHSFRAALPGVPFVFDTVDLHFLREERGAELGMGSRAGAGVTRELELAIMRATDATLVVSDVEQRLLAEIQPQTRVFVVSNVHGEAEVAAYEGRRDITFVGSFQHPPNGDAIRWFVREVLPLVTAELGDVPVTVVGRNPPADLVEDALPGVQFLGWVEDLEPIHARSLVSIAPLRYGAGVKGKVGDAWAHGVPAVMTTVAAEGMRVAPGITAFVADDPAGFADGVIRLYRDRETWERMSAESVAHVAREFGTERIESDLRDVAAYVASVRSGIEA